MRIKIKKGARCYNESYFEKGRDNWLLANSGKWAEVDTGCLFNNQYNTVDGVRVYDVNVSMIEGDVRVNRCKCGYCGDIIESDVSHLKHVECILTAQEDFNKCFFVVNPGGHDEVIEINKRLKIKGGELSLYSVNGNYYRISRRKNIHFVLAGGEIWITNGIGYRHYKEEVKEGRLTSNEVTILLKCVEEIEKEKQPRDEKTKI